LRFNIQAQNNLKVKVVILMPINQARVQPEGGARPPIEMLPRTAKT